MTKKTVCALALMVGLTTIPALAAPAPNSQQSTPVTSPLTLDRDLIAGLPRVSVQATGHDGVTAQYDGIELSSLLAKAGFPIGPQLRGRNAAAYLVAEAPDHYKVVFALAELDPAVQDGKFILADTKNGKPLPADEGPFRIVIPSEKRPLRWIRQVRTLSLRYAD